MADREKVLRWLAICGENMDCSECCPYLEKKYKDPVECMSALMRDALELLKKQPEQKHGHWIPIKLPTGVGEFGYKEYMVQEVTCSECKFTEDVSASAYLYCPNCGAKMDEEAKQNE